MTDAATAVMAQVERDQEFLIELTQRMVRIPTVNPKFVRDPAINREADLQDMLQPILEDAGLQTELSEPLPGRPNLTGTRPGTEARSLSGLPRITVAA